MQIFSLIAPQNSFSSYVSYKDLQGTPRSIEASQPLMGKHTSFCGFSIFYLPWQKNHPRPPVCPIRRLLGWDKVRGCDPAAPFSELPTLRRGWWLRPPPPPAEVIKQHTPFWASGSITSHSVPTYWFPLAFKRIPNWISDKPRAVKS